MREEHQYISTACHHELHDRCRKSCKFCAVACKCPCHDGQLSEASPAQTDSGEWLDELELLAKSGRLPFESGKLIEAAPRLIAIARAAALMADALSMYVDEDDPFRGDVAALVAYKEAAK